MSTREGESKVEEGNKQEIVQKRTNVQTPSRVKYPRAQSVVAGMSFSKQILSYPGQWIKSLWG